MCVTTLVPQIECHLCTPSEMSVPTGLKQGPAATTSERRGRGTRTCVKGSYGKRTVGGGEYNPKGTVRTGRVGGTHKWDE